MPQIKLNANLKGDKKHSPRFKRGKVWVTFSDDKPELYTIKSVNYQPLTRVYMYSFEETTVCCGEHNLRRKLTDRKLRLGECIHDSSLDDIGILEEGINKTTGAIAADGIRTFSGGMGVMFFRPDREFISWLVEYANGRIIVEVGCGTARVLNDLANAGGKVMGIEPYWSVEDNMGLTKHRLEQGKGIINIMPRAIQECGTFLKALGDKPMYLICRPCHSNFVEDTITLKHPDAELLYITIPENWDRYSDMGKYKHKAVQLNHKGWSADKEQVWSVK